MINFGYISLKDESRTVCKLVEVVNKEIDEFKQLSPKDKRVYINGITSEEEYFDYEF